MIALDTNILVHARREEAQHHASAVRLLSDLAEGDEPWSLPWPCVYEFLRVVTHPRVFSPPTDLEAALEDLSVLFEAPSLTLLGEGPNHRVLLHDVLSMARTTGNLVHDGHIAVLLREHAVREFWTTDRDFARFSGIRTRNPFLTRDLHEPRATSRSPAWPGRAPVRKRSSARR